MGKGATRQMLAYHEVRQPDVVTGAFVGAAALGCFLTVRKHPVIGAAVPAALVLLRQALGTSEAGSRLPGRSGAGWSRRSPSTARI